ncbi:MAG: hypothetical protein WAU69_07065, partial [Solirubrobacteraceae bacterium]
IKANVDELQATDANEVELSGKTKLLLGGVYSVYPDPEGVMSSIIAPGQIHPPGSGLNTANYRNPEVDKLLTESVETLSKAKRLQLIGRLLKVTNEEVPYWPLFTYDTFMALSEKYVMAPFTGWSLLWGQWALGVKLPS